nr:glycosyltransferase family 39 protein [Rubellimicrobium sp. CFH 75288]
MDEAEAFFHARQLAWGYGPQPPLYFWLQWVLFQIFGESLLALAVLKALLLGGTLLAVLHLARPVLGPVGAAATALSLGLLPQVLWEAQRALTHSVLVLLLAVATTSLALRALRRGDWMSHLLLGLGMGLGVLSKYNFVFWPAALLTAAVVLPEWRARLRPTRLGLALLAVVGVCAPHLLWIVSHPEAAGASAHKLGLSEAGHAQAIIRGTLNLVAAGLSFLALAVLVLGPLLWCRRDRLTITPVVRFLLTASFCAIGLVWLSLVVSSASNVRDRWLLPLLWPVAPAAVMLVWQTLPARGRERLIGGLAAPWIVAAALLPYASLVDPGWRGLDWRPLAGELRRLGGGEVRPVFTDDPFVAGNLVFLAPSLDPVLVQDLDTIGPGAVLILRKGEASSAAPALGEAGMRAEVVAVRGVRRTLELVLAHPEAAGGR